MYDTKRHNLLKQSAKFFCVHLLVLIFFSILPNLVQGLLTYLIISVHHLLHMLYISSSPTTYVINLYISSYYVHHLHLIFLYKLSNMFILLPFYCSMGYIGFYNFSYLPNPKMLFDQNRG